MTRTSRESRRNNETGGWLRAGGEMVGRIRGFDWTATRLGGIDSWPASLKGSVEIMLAAGPPSALVWGSDLTILFNDAWRHQIGGDDALGQPTGPDVGLPWSVWKNALSDALESGEAATVDQREAPSCRAVPLFGEAGRPLGLSIRLETAQRDRPDWLSLALDLGRVAIWDWDLPSGSFAWSEEHARIYGLDPATTVPSHELWMSQIHPEDRPRVAAALDAARPTGDTIEESMRIVRPDGSERWCMTRARITRDARMRPTRIAGVLIDIDDFVRAQRRQLVLVGELQHRVRNTLSVVRSILRRTAAAATDIDELVARLEGRINALARVQTILSRNPDHGIDLEGLLREELRAVAFGRERDVVEGPEVSLSPRAAERVSLAFHELATNAVQHGALSVRHGALEVRWRVEKRDGRDHLNLTWRERGHTRPVRPARRGFGTELLERTLPYELDATVSYENAPEGFRCDIMFPLQNDGRREYG